MVRALQTISGRSQMEHVPSDFKEMMIDYPRTGFFGLFSTHPPIEHRIGALQSYAGARVEDPVALVPRIRPKRSPWGERRNIWK